jgi:MFS family permease
LGIPIASWADRGKRTGIIGAGIFVWSIMTALCGLARNFPQMFLARVGVGVGEAALSPAAYSMLADYFPPKRLARALSVYSAAIYVGSGVALIAGGALVSQVQPLDLPVLGHMEPWQVVFLWVGLPGIPIVALMATVREPVRRDLAKGGTLSLRAAFAYLTKRRGVYGLLLGGYGLRGMVWQGTSAWIPTFFIRSFHWDSATIGLRWGLVVMVMGAAGNIAGGWLAGWMKARGAADANHTICIAATIIVLPFGVAAPLLSDANAALAVYAGFTFFASFPNGAMAAALQEITPNQVRAQISALYLFASNMFGIGLGATVVAVFTDYVFSGGEGLRYALALTIALVAPATLVLLWCARRPFRRGLAEFAQI